MKQDKLELLVARKSPLGWVVFGGTSQDAHEPSRIWHLKYTTPVDLSDFWITEAMGVAVTPCLCVTDKLSQIEREEAKVIASSCQKAENRWVVSYPWKRDPALLLNNKSQARKKLEATERRLMKNTEHAKAYDKQIVEMSETAFARKFKPSVSVRVGEIQYNQFRHLPVEACSGEQLNVADDVSRGIPVRRLAERWQHGPKFLRLPENQWPQDASNNDKPKVEEE